MKKTNTNEQNKSLGFTTTLTLIFITLKLCKVISWSWMWVLSPLWIGAIIAIPLSIICILLAKSIAKDEEEY